MFGRKKKSNKNKILVVEDDALLARVLMDVLVKNGFEALNVKNGLLVMDALSKFKPDLILLDLILPGLDGFEILKQVKANTEFKEIPVFVTSNLDDAPDVKSARVLEAEEYFIKANTQIEEIIKKVKARLS